MTDDQTARANRGPWRALRTLTPYLWPAGRRDLRLRVVGALVCLALAKLANVTVPLVFKQAVDALNTGDAMMVAAPLGLLVAYGLARLGTVLFQELREALFSRIKMRAMRKAALGVFQHLHALSLRFHLDRRTGGLSRVIERGVKGIEFILDFSLFNILPTLLEILLVCGILWGMFDFSFSAVTLATIGGYIAFTLMVTEWRLKFRRHMNARDTEANSKAVDSLLNYETVKYFGNEAHEAARFDQAMRGYEGAAVRSILSLSLVNVGQGLIIALGLVSLMAMAGRGVAAGTMTLGDFVLVNTYLIQLYMPLNFLGFVYRQIRQSLTDMEDMFSLLDVDREIADRPNAGKLRKPAGAVTFDAVHFGYDPRRPILRGLSFAVPPGGSLAIVGTSGAGKSTIGRLLFRFYDVDDGAIMIDGKNIRDLSQQSLRAAIGVVPQDTVLFNDTIFYNILYGRPDATRREVEHAAQLARIHDFVSSLPDGYDSMVGERGLKLSGGEKQRVAIARAILKDPAILLFDEATSALDSATEREIHQSIREISRDRTALIIAHRLSTVVDADEILVLAHGQTAERGRHETLLRRGGLYAEMWARQQEDAEKGEAADAAPAAPTAWLERNRPRQGKDR